MALFFLPKAAPVSGGENYAQCKLYFYATGTSTAATVYTDSALTTAHPQPVVADAGGVFAPIYVDSTISYRVVLRSSGGSLIWDVDPFEGPLASTEVVGEILHPVTADETAAGVTPSVYQYPCGDARRYGAVGNGSANDTSALLSWWAVGKQGVCLTLPAGTYLTSVGLRATAPLEVRGEYGSRIKLTSAASYVIELDYTGTGASYDHGGVLRDLILDGGSYATDGLSLKGVISATFDNIRATNVTTAGLHLHWAQLCEFNNFVCSNNVETFTTTPVNGVLADTASCSANIFKNLTVEHVSGAGVKAISLVNSVFLNGTSEGNDIGLLFGAASGALTAIGNVVVGMDLEVNTTTDIQLLATSQANSFFGLAAGYSSPAVDVNGGIDNVFVGGVTGGFDFDANANRNQIIGTKLLGTGRGIVDVGTGNAYTGVFNITDGTYVKEKGVRGRANHAVSSTGDIAIDAASTALVVVTFSGSGTTTLTFTDPTNPTDGLELEVAVHVTGAGTLTLAWGSAFKTAGVTVPANTFNRSYRFRYDANYAKWYLTAQSPADIPN